MSTILSNNITSIGGGGVTIKVGTSATYISEGGAVTNSNLNKSLTKSYVFFDGTASTPSADGSFNHSSVTDQGSGQYRHQFTNSMSNANFSSSGYANSKNVGNGSTNTSFLQIEVANTSFQSADDNRINGIVVGDLA